MKRMLAALLGASTVAIPLTATAGAVTRGHATTRTKKTETRKATGTAAAAHQWGSVQVIVTEKITRSGSKKTIRYTDLGGSYSYHTSRSQFIMTQSLPLLRQEFLQRQSANIQLISGATDTSQAFEQSLQAALLKLSK
jgi:uncharacterized protein with FMN-binding domain